MPSMRDIRNRINGVAKTKQITRSMRMVSSAKVQKAKGVFESSRPHAQYAKGIMDILTASPDVRESNYFQPSAASKTLVVAISTDRGLCGAYNMNVARKLIKLSNQRSNLSIVTVGSKIVPALRREKLEVQISYAGIAETPMFEEAEALGEALLQLFEEGQVDEVRLVYTRFVSVLEQYVEDSQLLPYVVTPNGSVPAHVAFEPQGSPLIKSVVSAYVNAVLYQAFVESTLCEQTARVNSMDAAVRNSDELVEKLTLQYNQMRQAGITNQIIEIMGGVSATEKR